MFLWTLALAALAAWFVERRSWTELGMVTPHRWRIFGTMGLLLCVAILCAPPIIAIERARRSNKRIRFPKDVARGASYTGGALVWWIPSRYPPASAKRSCLEVTSSPRPGQSGRESLGWGASPQTGATRDDSLLACGRGGRRSQHCQIGPGSRARNCCGADGYCTRIARL